MASAAVWWPPLGREPLPGRARTVATRPQRREGADSPPLPSRFHPRHRRSRSHGHRSPAFNLPPAAFEPRLPPGGSAFGTFGAGTRRREFCNRSHVRTHAQSCAEFESPRARVLYIAGCELPPATVLRTGARDEYQTRYLTAYCHRRSHAGEPRPCIDHKIPGGMHLPVSRPEIPMAERFVAERGRGDFANRSRARPHAQSRAELESLRARVPYIAGCEFSPATVLRGTAHSAYRKRFLGAYGSHRPSVGTPRRSSTTKSLA